MKETILNEIRDHIKSKGINYFRKSSIYFRCMDKNFTKFLKWKNINLENLKNYSDDEIYDIMNSDTFEIYYVYKTQYYHIVFKCPNGGQWPTGYYKNGYLEAQSTKFYEHVIVPILREYKINSLLV
jgi:hypothetical protein